MPFPPVPCSSQLSPPDPAAKATHRAEVGAVASDARRDSLGVPARSGARLQAARGQGLLDVTGVGVLVAKGDGEARGLGRGRDVNRALVADTGVLERVELGEVSLEKRSEQDKAERQTGLHRAEAGRRTSRRNEDAERRTGSVEKTGPSGARFTMKELALRRRSHWRSEDILKTGREMRSTAEGSARWLHGPSSKRAALEQQQQQRKRQIHPPPSTSTQSFRLRLFCAV